MTVSASGGPMSDERRDQMLERFERALRFYAERRNYQPARGAAPQDVPLGGWLSVVDSFDEQGPGARARAALSYLRGDPT